MAARPGGTQVQACHGRAERQGATQLHRSRQPRDAHQERLHPGLQRQAAVDGAHQIIVAHTLTNSPSDQAQFAPLLDAIKANLGMNPDEASADVGYCSQANLRTLVRRRIEGYVATGRQKHGTKAATAKRKLKSGTLIARMSTKLKRAGCRSRYRLRKQIVEPVFGQIKQARGFRQFLLRGIDKVKAEWAMICTAHNLTNSQQHAKEKLVSCKKRSELDSLGPKSITGTAS
nr:transposase [Bradyrhizobium sp. 156]